MQKKAREVSCYITSLVIKYCRQKAFDVNTLFKGIEDKIEILENPHEWIDYTTLIQLTNNFEQSGGNLYKAGIAITENQVSHFQLMFLKVASLPYIIQNYSRHFERAISPFITLTIELPQKGTLDIIFTPQDKTKYSPQICDFNRGCTFATGRLKRLRNLQITEVTCAARSNAHECRYRVTWDPGPSILERLKTFFLFRFRSQGAILDHMEENYHRLQEQHREIVGIKDFYHHIMENMQEGIVWCDAVGKISYVNKGFLQIVNLAGADDCIGRPIQDYFNDELSRQTYTETFLACHGKPGKPDTCELTLKSSSGEQRIGQTTCLWVDSAQQKPGFLLSIRDITQRRKIERRLFVIENRYRALYENSPAVIIGVDMDGYIIYANPAMEEQSEYTEQELKKMHFSELIASQGSTVDARSLLSQRLIKVGLQEMHYRTKSGRWKSLALTTFPLFDDSSKALNLGCVGVDITETKRLNEILIHTQRMDLLGQMAGGLAHDFKNLLSVISGYCELITGHSSEPKIRNYSSNIKIANDRAVDLIRNLLTFSRGETVKNEPFVMNTLVREVLQLLPPIIGKKIAIFLDPPEKEFQVKGDSNKIHQTLLNLCINARDALTGNAEGRITLRIKPDPQPGWLAVEVEDNGPGIPPDILGRIFDPFFSTKKRGEGTGLGLSVVYGIIKAHNGEILVDSRPGEGATFTIRLPIYNPVPETVDSRSPINVTKGHTILIVDNDEVSRNYSAEILRRQNYAVVPFDAVPQYHAWLQDHPAGEKIALIPVSQSSSLQSLADAHSKINVIWIAEHGSPALSDTGRLLRRPFPPAALIEEVRSVEQSS
jgi:two-component system cell cycle sensor histidine kinase/response regulator CckA